MYLLSAPSTLLANTTSPKKGGRPRGTTEPSKIKSKMIIKQARNWVCLEYADAKAQAGKNLVGKDLRERLVIETKIKFVINGKFDVPRTIILSRIKADNLVVINT